MSFLNRINYEEGPILDPAVVPPSKWLKIEDFASQQAMVYGFKDCYYYDVLQYLDRQTNFTSPLRRLIDATPLHDSVARSDVYTLDRCKIEHVDKRSYFKASDPKNDFASGWKRPLVDLVFENFQRKNEGLPPIPLIFCIDSDEKRFKSNPATLSSKTKHLNKLITHKELRRAYKLLEEYPDPRIRAAAAETFIFVKVWAYGDKKPDRHYKFEMVDPPWKKPDWKIAWDERTKQRQPKKCSWRDDLAAHIAKYDSFALAASLRVASQSPKKELQ